LVPKIQALPQLQARQAPPRPRIQGVPVGPAPARMPDGGKVSSMRGRSVFDQASFGPGAQVQQIRLVGTSPLIDQAPVPASPQGTLGQRPRVIARPTMGQEETPVTPPTPTPRRAEVERIIQRELDRPRPGPGEGLTREEAAVLANALGPAIDASEKALAEEIQCGRIGSATVLRVRTLREILYRYAEGAETRDLEETTAEDLDKVDAVLACQAVYEQMAAARKEKTIMLVVGGLVVGAVVIVAVS